jgi:CRP/FNR family transcriptional regulator, cyclic AMP receptor protein
MEDIKILKKIILFEDLKITEIMNVAMVAKKVKYNEDDLIFAEGTPGDALYVVKSGQVKVTKKDADGEEHLLAYIEPGEYFGEISLADQAPRSASVYAKEPTQLLMIKNSDFKNLIAGDKEIERKFYRSFTKVLCERIRVTNDNLTFSKEINKIIQDLK